MSRHIIDTGHKAAENRLLFRYTRLAKKQMPHKSSKSLQKRATKRSNPVARRLAYLRIETGRIA